MGRSRHGLVVALLAVTALTAYVGLDIVDAVPGGLTRAPPAASGSASGSAGPGPGGDRPSGPSSQRPAEPGARLADPAAMPLLAVSTGAPPPTAAGVSRVIGPLARQAPLGASVGLDVRDAASGTVLYRADATRPRTPASVAKVLTAVALATTGDLGARMPTRAVLGQRPGEVVLVAGGDMLLAPGRGNPAAVVGRAGLGDLADQVAGRLRAAGLTQVTARLDATLAAGPPLAPEWNRADVRTGFVGPVGMIGLATGRAAAGRAAPTDPAAAALSAFRSALRARGLLPANPAAGQQPSVPSTLTPGTRLGEVLSAPVRDVLVLALEESDNALTESLARRAAAAAGTATSFTAVGAWVRDRVAAAGIDVTGVRLADASGLSASSRVPATALSGALALAAGGRQLPSLAQVISQLPVAGLSGTLQDRYRSAATRAGAGLVRAKTGTLTGVSSLAGTVVDADGRLLVFTVMADRVPAAGTSAARVALDRLVTALAGCGCR